LHRQRTFLQRGKPVHVTEITDWVAVRPHADAKESASAAGGEDPTGFTLRATEVFAQSPEGCDLPAGALDDFQNSGWCFLPADRREDLSEHGGQPARILVRPGGRIALDTGHLTVRLRELPDERDAGTVLSPFGIKVVEQLRFAPRLYRVAVDPPGSDTLDVAETLMKSGLVEFAEPELIEPVKRR
jgi:hypothetical protein